MKLIPQIVSILAICVGAEAQTRGGDAARQLQTSCALDVSISCTTKDGVDCRELKLVEESCMTDITYQFYIKTGFTENDAAYGLHHAIATVSVSGGLTGTTEYDLSPQIAGMVLSPGDGVTIVETGTIDLCLTPQHYTVSASVLAENLISNEICPDEHPDYEFNYEFNVPPRLLGERKKCAPANGRWPGDFKLLTWNAGNTESCARLVEQDSDCSSTFMVKRKSYGGVEDGTECRCVPDGSTCSLVSGNSWNTFELN